MSPFKEKLSLVLLLRPSHQLRVELERVANSNNKSLLKQTHPASNLSSNRDRVEVLFTLASSVMDAAVPSVALAISALSVTTTTFAPAVKPRGCTSTTTW